MKLKDKQAGIKAMEGIIGMKAAYMGPPTFEYRIGDFTVDRYGVVHGDEKAVADLEEKLANEGQGSVEARHLEAQMAVNDPKAIRNLVNLLHSKQYLLNRALGCWAFSIPRELITAISGKGLTADEMTERMRDIRLKGIQVQEGGISVTGFPDTEVYRKLAGAILRSAAKASWIPPEEIIKENEKYYMRSWLIRIGLDGKDGREVRRTLLKNLKGHSAYRDMDAYG